MFPVRQKQGASALVHNLKSTNHSEKCSSPPNQKALLVDVESEPAMVPPRPKVTVQLPSAFESQTLPRWCQLFPVETLVRWLHQHVQTQGQQRVLKSRALLSANGSSPNACGYTYIHIYTYIDIYIYTYMHTYIHRYLHGHTHTHTHTQQSTRHNQSSQLGLAACT